MRYGCATGPECGLDGAAPGDYTYADFSRESTMTSPRDGATQAVLDKLLAEHGLTGDTRLYREAERGSLISLDTPGTYQVRANPNPSESVVDVYGQGHLVQAEQVGPGLAFAESAAPNWQETMELRALKAGRGKPGSAQEDRVEVEVRLQDILGQGGRVYPVESVTVERVWYCTLPAGSVEVREVR